MLSPDQVAEAYRLYGGALCRKAERIVYSADEAEDVVHSMFTEFVSRPPKSLELPFLYRAVGNRCLNRIRDHKNRERLLQQVHRDAPTTQARQSCEGVAISLDILAKLVDGLDRKALEVLVALYIDDMNQDEAAKHLGTSRRTIGKRLRAIRAAVEAVSAERVAL